MNGKIELQQLCMAFELPDGKGVFYIDKRDVEIIAKEILFQCLLHDGEIKLVVREDDLQARIDRQKKM